MIRRFLGVTVVATTLFGTGACSLLPFRHHAGKPEPPDVPGPTHAGDSRTSTPRTPWSFLKRKHAPPPPKAAPLSDVGTIQSLSADGSYVIAELAPGTLVRTGDVLLVTSTEHPVSRLKVAEVQPPCFAAEVVEGTAAPGEIVKR